MVCFAALNIMLGYVLEVNKGIFTVETDQQVSGDVVCTVML